MFVLSDAIGWLFNDKVGVVVLIALGLLFFGILAVILELKTRKTYYNHEDAEE